MVKKVDSSKKVLNIDTLKKITRIEYLPRVVYVSNGKTVVRGGYAKKIYSADIVHRIEELSLLGLELSNAKAKIEETKEFVVSLEEAVATQKQELTTSFTNADQTLNEKINITSSSISTIQESISSINSSIASTKNTLRSEFQSSNIIIDGKIVSNKAQIEELSSTVSTNSSATAEQINTLSVSYNDQAGDLDALKKQVDGKVEFFEGIEPAVDPTTFKPLVTTEPYKTWYETDILNGNGEQRALHTGDTYEQYQVVNGQNEYLASWKFVITDINFPNADADGYCWSVITNSVALDAYKKAVENAQAVAQQTIILQETNALLSTVEGWSAKSTKLITDANGNITGYSFSDGSNQKSIFKISAEQFILSNGSNDVQIVSIDSTTGIAKMNAIMEFSKLQNVPSFQTDVEVSSSIDSAKADLLEDIDTINNSISQNEIDKANLDGKIDAEETARINAINTETTQRAADNLERIQAEIALDGKIDTTEQELIDHANTLSDAQADYTDTVKQTLIDGEISDAETNAIAAAQTKVNEAKTELQNLLGLAAYGVVPCYGGADYDSISYDENEKAIRLKSSTDSSIGMAFPAFKVNKTSGEKFNVELAYKANSSCSSGFYIGIFEYDNDLPSGKTHISNSAVNTVVQEDTRRKAFMKNNAAITDQWQNFSYDYTPTSTAKYASIVILNWSGMGVNSAFIRDYEVTPLLGVLATKDSIDIDMLPDDVKNSSLDWITEVQSALANDTTTIDGSKIVANQAFLNMLNTLGIIAKDISVDRLVGVNLIGSIIEGAVVKASYLDLDGELEVLTNFHISVSSYNSNPSAYTDAVFLEGLNEYRIPTISNISKSGQSFVRPNSGYTAGAMTYSHPIYSYSASNVGSNLKAVKAKPSLEFTNPTGDTQVFRGDAIRNPIFEFRIGGNIILKAVGSYSSYTAYATVSGLIGSASFSQSSSGGTTSRVFTYGGLTFTVNLTVSTGIFTLYFLHISISDGIFIPPFDWVGNEKIEVYTNNPVLSSYGSSFHSIYNFVLPSVSINNMI